MNKIKVSIPGGNGRMGKTLIGLILENEQLIMGNASCLPDEQEIGMDLGLLVGKNKIDKYLTDKKNFIFQDTDVVIDFTVPEASIAHAETASQKRIPIVIGTTGFNEKEIIKLKELSKKIPIVLSANFSIGISVMQDLVDDAVKKLGMEWDIEVLETHHNKKIDSPSGTALLIADAAAKARSQDLNEVMNVSRNGIIGQRKKEEIGVAVLRGGDVVGEHSIRFYNSNERIEINHIATNRSIFAKGAIRSAIWAYSSGPGFFSLKDVIKHN